MTADGRTNQRRESAWHPTLTLRPVDPPGVTPDREAVVDLGVGLLAHLEHGELSVAEAMDRIEVVTTHPATQRAILEAAEEREIIDREGGTIEPIARGTYARFQRDVEVKDGEFSCDRCGATITEGHFLNLDAGELGPFGSTCIRYVLGREEP